MIRWKDIPNYEGIYQISDNGVVRSSPRMVSMVVKGTRCESFRRGRTIKGYKTAGGYMQVKLYKNGIEKHHLIHRLVAEAFIPNKAALPQVNHKDENKANNLYTNLEWCTAKENSSYGTRPQRLQTRVVMYTTDGEKIREFESMRDAAKFAGCNYTSIVHCCKGDVKTAKGYIWKYFN